MVLLTNFPHPTEGIVVQQMNTSVDIDGHNHGNGTLYIAESCVAWQKEDDGQGFSLQYPAISCHAVSRDLSSFPHECLYLMIDGKLSDTVPEEDASNDEEDDESGADVSEIRFIPSNKESLQGIYNAMSTCQALHPDPEDIDSENELDNYDEDEGGDAGGYFGTEEGFTHLTSEGRARLAQFDSMLQAGQGDNHPHVDALNGHFDHSDGNDGDEPMDLNSDRFEDAE